MPQTTYNNAWITDGTSIGRGLSAFGSHLIVANADSSAINTPGGLGNDTLARPWQLHAATTGTPNFARNHLNIIPIIGKSVV